jgi:Glucose / Sorbosone dehydrogenase
MRCNSFETLEPRTLLSTGPLLNNSPLSIALTGNLPTAILVAGQNIPPIHELLRITNPAATAVTGPTQISLELSPDPTGSSGGTDLTTITRHLNLKPTKSSSIPLVIHSLPASPTGALFILAVVTDPSGNTAFTASSNSLTVAAPTIDLAPLSLTTATKPKPGKKGSIRVTITNNGNIPATGPLAIDLQASASGLIDANSLDLGTITRHIALPANKKITLLLSVTFPTIPGPFFIVANVDPQNTFIETTLANNQLASANTIFGPTSLTDPIVPGIITVKLTRLTTVPAADGTPQDIVTAPGVAGTQFITTRTGDILTLTNGVLSTTPFLDMSAAGITIFTGGEGGLFCLAFSPTFSTPGTFGFDKFYTFETEPFDPNGPPADFSQPELFPTTSTDPSNEILIREWTVSSPTATTANTTSRVIMRIDHPETNHQGGALRFGPDGDLYIGLGDGGGGNDENGPANDPTDGHTNATGNAQDPSVVFGKILRINPNPNAGAGFTISANSQYSTPNNNPFATGGGLPEIFAMGLRNPFRMSFDPTSGKLYVGNVGQNTVESIDIVTNGGNYGWPYFEGTRNNQSDTGRTAPANFTYTAPIAEYMHNDGQAVMGGQVDRSTSIPALNGDYIFGDLGGPSSGGAIGRLFYTPAAGGTISEFNYDPTGIIPSSNLFGFGTDQAGNIDALFSNGDILLIGPAS